MSSLVKSTFVLTLFLLSLSPLVLAQCTPMTLFDLSVRIYYMEDGEISSIYPEKYEVRGSYGSGKDKQLFIHSILKPQDTACFPRWTNYAVGQEVLLFVSYDSAANVFSLMGSGHEMELPMKGKSVFIPETALPGAEEFGIKIKEYKLYGAGFRGHKVKWKHFIDVINYINYGFDHEYDSNGRIVSGERIVGGFSDWFIKKYKLCLWAEETLSKKP